MQSADGNGSGWDSSWLVALHVIKSAQRVFTPGSRPPGELMPLVDPVIRLTDALRGQSRDDAQARRCALDLVANTEAITWACQPGRSREVRELGMMLAWLSKTLNA